MPNNFDWNLFIIMDLAPSPLKPSNRAWKSKSTDYCSEGEGHYVLWRWEKNTTQRSRPGGQWDGQTTSAKLLTYVIWQLRLSLNIGLDNVGHSESDNGEQNKDDNDKIAIMMGLIT